jgi:hypothetical protein
MSDLTNILKAELGVKQNKSEHHHHHHDKIIVSQTETTNDVTHELQSQLGQSKKVDQEIQQEKDENK